MQRFMVRDNRTGMRRDFGKIRSELARSAPARLCSSANRFREVGFSNIYAQEMQHIQASG
jgi:hypothetical protein